MIEVGEYIRTKNGFIDEVIIEYNGKCNNPKCNYKHISCKNNYYNEDNIVNHSKNIAEIIEAGDYVNGSKLISIDYAEDEFGNCDKLHFYYHFEDEEKDVNEYYEKLNIKGILTKEQFVSMEYKVKEE